MRQIICLAVLLILLPQVGRAQTLEPVDASELRAKPISTVTGPVGDLLRQWWKEGTAAGNIGDYYDNRDGDHSPLNLTPFPQLLTVKYSADDIKLRKHWASQHVIHPAVVFGNSSTSAPPTLGGSNPRHYYCATRGLSFLAEEYAKNNLYIYPEHRDHDPGHNGKGDGFGDLYPTNTPYLLISQGSSGSDQPFMRAIPLALAAFRPEVKKKLTETGTLMPTLQWILRSTNKHLKGPEEYLTGKAHPSVFEGSWVDELAMVKLAHSLELKSLPPIVQLKVIEEDKAVAGVDYFEDGATEQLADTPAVIARIHRSKANKRRLVVSAEASHDLNKAPLTFKWVILRGDPKRIEIKPRNPEGSVAEITVAHHERRPVAPGSPLESNRVDIGVFVHNGTYHSAPAFVTFFTLDNELRTYDDKGGIVEIGHGMGECELRVAAWDKVLAALATEAGKRFGLDDARRAECAALGQRHAVVVDELRTAQKLEQQKAAELAKTKDPKDMEPVRKELDAARKETAARQKNLNALLDDKNLLLGTSVRSLVEDGVRSVARKSVLADGLGGFKVDMPPEWKQSQAALPRLRRLGLARENPMLTAYDRYLLENAQLAYLTDSVFQGAIQITVQPNFVDQRLTAPKPWRDIYHYDSAGASTGWTRHHADLGVQDFNHEGLLVQEKDDIGRCKSARTVRYTRTLAKGAANPNPLRMELGYQLVRYEFASPDDRRGKQAGIEAVK